MEGRVRNNFQTNKINYYLDKAEELIIKSCIRNNYGCVIVKDDKIISSGYTGAPTSWKTCASLGECLRRKHNMPSGMGYDLCRSVHAEWRALISASPEQLKGSTLYLVGINARSDKYVDDNEPCSICKRMIIESGISTVVMRDTKETYRIARVSDWSKNDDTLD